VNNARAVTPVHPAGLPIKVAHPMIPRNAARVVARGTIHSIALFVSARDSAEIRAHATPYFLGPMVDSITNAEVDSLYTDGRDVTEDRLAMPSLMRGLENRALVIKINRLLRY
jgi:hypothetical protein